MNISKTQRSWLLGTALLLTLAAAASVNDQNDQGIGLVQPKPEKVRVTLQSSEPSADMDPSPDMLVDKLKRPQLPEQVKDMFISKSWYVPPPPSLLVPVRPSAPAIPFHFIGKMIDDSDHPAVFLEKQNRIFVVREGDSIDAIYRVDRIKPPQMTLTYLPLDEKQTVQIGEAN
jgi:hypothetical protein